MKIEIIEIKKEDKNYPLELLKIKKPPEKLYAIGNIGLLYKQKIFGIVGSRNCSEYGRKVAYTFASELSKDDITIVSGMAIGIDTSAHIGAIDKKGKTIAVLGGGFNKIYPESNEWLFHKILSLEGLVISEYAPNVDANTRNFPERNRIISGLSNGILVVEAEYRSGSTITANFANSQNKKVYAIPSNIYSSQGIGTNALIRKGAILVTEPSDIKNDIFKNTNSRRKKSKIKNNEENFENSFNQNDNLNLNNKDLSELNLINNFSLDNQIYSNQEIPKEYLEIYGLLKGGVMYINEIASKTKKSISELNSILTIMEIEGYIKRLASNQFEINKI